MFGTPITCHRYASNPDDRPTRGGDCSCMVLCGIWPPNFKFDTGWFKKATLEMVSQPFSRGQRVMLRGRTYRAFGVTRRINRRRVCSNLTTGHARREKTRSHDFPCRVQGKFTESFPSIPLNLRVHVARALKITPTAVPLRRLSLSKNDDQNEM